MISAESDPQKRDEFLRRLMDLPNQVVNLWCSTVMGGELLCHLFFFFLNNDYRVDAQKWAEIIGQARQSVDVLKDADVIRAVLNILQVDFLLNVLMPQILAQNKYVGRFILSIKVIFLWSS